MGTIPRFDLSAIEILDHLAEAVSIVGPDGRRVHTNATARAVFESLAVRAQGRPVPEVDWGTLDAFGDPLPTARLPVEITRLTGEECSDVEVGWPDAQGSIRWLRINTRPLPGDGPPFGVVVSFTDVSAARRTAEEFSRQLTRYRIALSSLHEGVILRDASGQVVDVNARTEEALGLTRDQITGRAAIDPRWHCERIDGTTWPTDDYPANRVLASGQPERDQRMGVRSPDGSLRWLRVNAMPLHAADGSLDGVVTTFADETESIRARAALEQATVMFSTAFTAAPIGMALVDLDGGFLEVNHALCALTGYEEDELLARTFQEITHPDDLDADLELVRRLVAGEIPSYKLEKRYFTASGDLIWINLHVSLVRGPGGTPERFISQIEDITERKRMEQSLQRLADHDPLTELWNRRRFEEELQRQVGRCKRYHEQAALFLLDLDDFKRVNDTLGHKAGDDLLCAVAETMRMRLRSTDSLARLGGDEFAVLLANVTADEAAALAEELVAAIRAVRITIRDRDVAATASIGVALLDSTVQSDESVLMAADIAMYGAKAAGRDRASIQPLPAPAERGDKTTAPPERMPPVEPASQDVIRVLHCDDSGPYRRLVELMLEDIPDLELVASVADHAFAVQETQRLQPDVVLLDARVPGGTDQAVVGLRGVAPDARIVVLSGLQDPDNVLRRAADGFILKTRSFDEIAGEIRAIARTGTDPEDPEQHVYGRGADADAAIETVRRIYEAFARRDIEDALLHTAPDVELMPHGTASLIGRTEPYRGHDGVREYFADAERVWKDLQISATDFRATAGGVVVFGSIEGESESERVRRQVVWVWQVRSNLAVSMRVSDIGEATPISPSAP
jgi:diguanylate cyclase (GGDEF)-like protein/PAS domain S-box-containing protein